MLSYRFAMRLRIAPLGPATPASLTFSTSPHHARLHGFTSTSPRMASRHVIEPLHYGSQPIALLLSAPMTATLRVRVHSGDAPHGSTHLSPTALFPVASAWHRARVRPRALRDASDASLSLSSPPLSSLLLTSFRLPSPPPLLLPRCLCRIMTSHTSCRCTASLASPAT